MESFPPPSKERYHWAKAECPTFHLPLLTVPANKSDNWHALHQHPTDANLDNVARYPRDIITKAADT